MRLLFSRNERTLRRFRAVVQAINAQGPIYEGMTDAELRACTERLRARLRQGESLDDILIDSFALVREASGRGSPGLRHYDVQLIGGIALHHGMIAEMATGEGKTLTATCPAFLNALTGRGVHIVTVNDYLARRDLEWMGPVFQRLGLTVSCIQADIAPSERKPHYEADVTYGTSEEFAFDYLRGNLAMCADDQVQRQLNYSIIDDVDSILIDKARTPIVMSASLNGGREKYVQADRVVRMLRIGVHFETSEGVYLTDEGIDRAQALLDVDSLFTPENLEWLHFLGQALRAYGYQPGRDYVVKDSKVVIIDPLTGRLLEGRSWSDGLHEAVEAKENLEISPESRPVASITIQNFFKLYDRIAGMTGTATTESREFRNVYGLNVLGIPQNRNLIRIDWPDRIYKTSEDKYLAIVEDIHGIHTKGRSNDPFVLEPVLRHLKPIIAAQGRSTELIDEALHDFDSCKGGESNDRLMTEAYDDAMGDLARGRPILVGTISIENSRILSSLLERRGIPHEVLSAEQHEREAMIVERAGQRDAVTIAAKMAGRGTDIELQQGVVYGKCIGPLGLPDNRDGRSSEQREHGVDGAKCCVHCPDHESKTNCAHCWKPTVDPRFPELGRKICSMVMPCGLHIVGTERHESRRIDNQLRGRSGRQGDPGSSRFFLSLGDDLLRMFMGEWMLKMLEKMGFEEGMAIEAKSISKGIERAQRKVEEKNFGIRKHLLEYDEVLDHQRKIFYSQRQEILAAARPGRSGQIVKMIWQMIDNTIEAAFAKFLAADYGPQCICDWVRGELEVPVETKIVDIYDLATTTRNIREEANDEARNQITLTVGEYMDPDLDPKQWDIRGLTRWAETRFGSTITQNQLRSMSVAEVQEHLIEAAAAKIDHHDLAPIEKFVDPLYGRRSLINWTRQKFGIDLSYDDFQDLRDEAITDRLRQAVRDAYRDREVRYPVEWILERTVLAERADTADAADALAQWANLKFNLDWTVDHVRNQPPKAVAKELFERQRDCFQGERLQDEIEEAVSRHAGAPGNKLAEWGKKRFGPAFNQETFDAAEDPRDALATFGKDLLRRELTVLERYVLLQIYDLSWKAHLYDMDLLQETIRPRGYAERDPKTVYKHEGSRMFQEMMAQIQETVTGIIFRARLADESAARSR